MTSISEEGFERADRQQLDIQAISQAYPKIATIIHTFAAFFTELNLMHYSEITSGEYVLSIDRTSRTHAFMVLLLALIESYPEVDIKCTGFLRFSDYWNKKEEKLRADILRLERPVTSKKWQSKLDVIIFEFDKLCQADELDRNDRYEAKLAKKLNAIRNICLRLWHCSF